MGADLWFEFGQLRYGFAAVVIFNCPVIKARLFPKRTDLKKRSGPLSIGQFTDGEIIFPDLRCSQVQVTLGELGG